VKNVCGEDGLALSQGRVGGREFEGAPISSQNQWMASRVAQSEGKRGLNDARE